MISTLAVFNTSISSNPPTPTSFFSFWISAATSYTDFRISECAVDKHCFKARLLLAKAADSGQHGIWVWICPTPLPFASPPTSATPPNTIFCTPCSSFYFSPFHPTHRCHDNFRRAHLPKCSGITHAFPLTHIQEFRKSTEGWTVSALEHRGQVDSWLSLKAIHSHGTCHFLVMESGEFNFLYGPQDQDVQLTRQEMCCRRSEEALFAAIYWLH